MTTITEPTRLYGFGSNGAGQLGVGHRDDLAEPQRCLFSPELTHDEGTSHQSPKGTDTGAGGECGPISKIVAGGNHTLVLTKQGRVYAAGSIAGGRCALPPSPEHDHLTVFTDVEWVGTRNVTDVAATWEASFFVEDRRRVWVCGSGAKGELGCGAATLESGRPRLVLDTKDLVDGSGEVGSGIVGIWGSMSHVVVLMSNGDVYGWGGSRKGQLGSGLEEEKIVWTPMRLEVGFDVTSVALGRDFTYLCNDDREAVLFGTLNAGQKSIEIQSGHTNTQCAAGWSTLYTMEDGKVRGTGEGRRGQLPPRDLPHLTKLSPGSEHCIAVADDDKIVTWGWGEHGNCGSPTDSRGNVNDHFNTIQLDAGRYKIAGIGAGCATSFVWVTEREPK